MRLGDSRGGLLKIQTTLLRNRIARRVSFLAFTSALLPLLLLGLTSLHQVSEELEQGILDRLDQEVRRSSTVVAQRLHRVETQLRGLTSRFNVSGHKLGSEIGLELLDKPARLSPEELRIIQEHPVVGARILEPIRAYKSALPIVLHHNERFDGKGYPDGLSGEDIYLHARIFAVADTYDAMASDRPYRAGMLRIKAVEIIRREAGRQFDPVVVDAFLKVMTAESRSKVATERLDTVEPAPTLSTDLTSS